jgi:hypothetical protein
MHPSSSGKLSASLVKDDILHACQLVLPSDVRIVVTASTIVGEESNGGDPAI